jgi:nucleotide-binding universal stress UspA family protein
MKFSSKRILVAYDLSDVSRMAWRHAAALAATCGATLEAVYVEPWKMGSDLMAPPDLTADRVEKLRAEIRSVTGDGPKITILQGDPALLILSFARQRRPDLIVVGTHGRTGLKRALLGSVAESVIRSSPVPVLAARGRPMEIFSILAPVNFTPYSDFGFAYAASAAAALSARLTALHVSDDPIWDGNPKFRLSSLMARLPAETVKKCRPVIAAAGGNVVDEILKARKGHDWIVLVAHEKSPLRDAVFGTTLEQVLRRSSIPVLSVPAPGNQHLARFTESGGSEARARSVILI